MFRRPYEREIVHAASDLDRAAVVVYKLFTSKPFWYLRAYSPTHAHTRQNSFAGRLDRLCGIERRRLCQSRQPTGFCNPADSSNCGGSIAASTSGSGQQRKLAVVPWTGSVRRRRWTEPAGYLESRDWTQYSVANPDSRVVAFESRCVG